MVCNIFSWGQIMIYIFSLGVKVQFAKLSWGQNTAYNTLLGVKVRFAMFLLGSKLGL